MDWEDQVESTGADRDDGRNIGKTAKIKAPLGGSMETNTRNLL